ncbi:hypothetical protein CR513_03035, partial [Mucuna pruriens]
MMMDRNIIDATSGGALMDKILAVTRNLISNMARVAVSRGINEVATMDSQRLENKITKLASLVRQLAIRQHHTSLLAKVCGICTSAEHLADACPTLQEIKPKNAEVIGLIGGHQYRGQPYGSWQYDVVLTDTRAIFDPKIRFRTKHALEPDKLPTIGSQIPSTTFPKTATTIGVAIGQFSFVRRVDVVGSKQHRVLAKCEKKQHVVPTKYERHNS